MAHPVVQDLNALLHSLPTLKPPGVSKSKVDAATRLCMDLQNIPVEPMFVDSLLGAFQQSPVSHKLGVLYIIDSIMRQWVVTGAAHAGGVRKMTDNLPLLMNEYLPTVPEPQKERLSKLFDIWISSKTFPAGMLVDFKTRLANASSSQHILTQAAPPNDPASLLAALAAPPQAAPPQAAQHQNQAQHQAQNNASANALLAALSGMGQHPAPTQQVTNGAPMNYAPSNPTMNYPPQNAPVARQQAPQQAQVPYGAPLQQQPALNLNALASLLPNAQGGAQDPNSLVNQLQMLQALGQQLGPDGFRTLVQALTMQQQQQQPLPPQPVAAQNGVFAQNPVAAPIPQNLNQYSAPTGNGYAPPGGQLYGARDDSGAGARERSRSPDWNQRRYSPPNRRDSPTYGSYDAHTGRVGSPRGQDDRRGRGRGRGGGRSDYRQRSPPSRNSPAPHSNQPKPIGYDNKLPDGCIKVLSRTLFVGGVKTSESDLKAFFGQFGGVQSCIVNNEKRHAFLKMITHQDTLATRQAVWNLPDSEYRSLFERVNWAVGFGPTHCADYNMGTSVIPLDLLTDADRKWLLTAEFGGTGGKAIAPGMVVEEPDIEIGAGPSSKAIHRRGGGQQGRGGRRGGYNNSTPDQGQPRHQSRQNRHEVPETNNYGPPPAVPTFGAPIPGFPFNFQR